MTRSSPEAQQNDVRRTRRALELTQAVLAEQVGVSRQTIIAIENGGYAPSVYLALALADALGTSVEALFRPARPATPEPPHAGSFQP
ncbi:helix-turn-helix domain-containing protein [Egibacter rhizosphaerae]|uniref:Helix-turn-helix domain-containing protein n=1 Tax=Egibacter rhizosphaerae TaxID=1670831 RepID=A0A411YIN3_9ACTN|nr:helix-turn-helix domain-containing protein [Egibacter rhizosphaerae]QBI21057.1 helix-turn-helix domain-containing protein [Egibacter rhizosphaerae]